MDEIREELRQTQRNLESLENSDAPERDIEKAKAKIRTLEAEHVKACNKYNKSVDAEKDEQSIQEDLEVLEDLQEEDLADVERGNAREALTAIQKRKEALGARKEHELRTLAYEQDPEKIQLAKEKLFELNKSYQEIVADENTFKTVLGEKLTVTEEKKKNSSKKTKKFWKSKIKKMKRFSTTETLGLMKKEEPKRELTFATKKSGRSTHNLKKAANLFQKKSRRFSKNMA